MAREQEEAPRSHRLLALGAVAFLVAATAPKTKAVFFGFAGEVKSVDGDNVTLTVKRATKSARKLLPDNQDVTFTTDDSTRVIVDGKKAALSDLSAGDGAAVGIRAPKGSTLEQVVATPAKVVLGLSKKASTAKLSRLAKRAAAAAKARH